MRENLPDLRVHRKLPTFWQWSKDSKEAANKRPICFGAYPVVATGSTSPGIATIFHAQQFGRVIKIIRSNLIGEKLHRMNQRSSFLGGRFSNRDNVRTPIQHKEKDNPIIFTAIVQMYEMGQMKQVKFFQHWNVKATSSPTPESLVIVTAYVADTRWFMTFITTLWVTGLLCSFISVLEWKSGNEILEKQYQDWSS